MALTNGTYEADLGRKRSAPTFLASSSLSLWPETMMIGELKPSLPECGNEFRAAHDAHTVVGDQDISGRGQDVL